MTTRPLTVLIAPDSFKGSLTSVQVARALADGWARARPDDTILLCPLADGGEGTLEAVAAAGGWEWQSADVADPLGRTIRARWLRSEDGARAVVEMAEASGLSRVEIGQRDAVAATSAGTGDLIRAAISAGAGSIVLGIGGSATTDGGAGLLRSLGAAADRDDATADLTDLDPRLSLVDLAVACDVSNPLLGPFGAAAVYGPQKGAEPGRRRGAGSATHGVRGCARGGGRHARPRHPRRGGGRWRRLRPARGGRSLPFVRPATRHRPRDGGDRLHRAPRRRRPGHHGRGPDRRPDRVREDRARCRAARGGGRGAVRRGRWWRRARGHRGAGGRRCGGGPGRRAPPVGRGGDGRGNRPARTLR